MFVCYVSVSIGSVFCVCSVSWSIVPVCLCSLLCLLGVPSVFCVCSTVCLCVAPFSLCVLFMCVLYVWRVSVVGLRVCACVCLLCLCVVSMCVLCVFFILCVSVCLFPCMYVYVCTVCLCSLFLVYVYVLCSCSVFVLLVTLLVWRLSWWCDGRLFLGLVVLVFWGVWRVWNFFIFYSRFGVGGRLLLGFCYRTFFCGFPWGLCRARNFFKDITHSYCGYVIPVMSLYMCLLAYLYHTQYCVDTVPVLPFVLVPAFACVRIYLRLCHPRVSFYVAPVLCLLYCVSCAYLCLHYVLVCGGGLHSVPCACL